MAQGGDEDPGQPKGEPMSKSKEQSNAEARERMAAYRATDEYRSWLERSREDRRLRKEKYRREAGARPRVDISLATAGKRAAAKLRSSIQDAHVRLYRRTRHQWEFMTIDERREATARQREKRNQDRERVSETYVRRLLVKNTSMKRSDIPAQLVLLKQVHIQIVNHINRITKE